MSYDNIGKYRQIQRQRAEQSAVPMDEIDRLEQARQALPPSWVPGWAEIPATLASGAASSAAGGLAGLGTMGLNALGLSQADPADVVRSIQQDYTYTPRTVEGMAGTYAAGKAFEALHKPVAWAADKTLEATGSPALATAVDVGPTALGALMGLPNATGRGALSAARSVVPAVAPSRAALGPGIRGQQGVIANAALIPEFEPAVKRALRMAAAGQGMQTIWDKTQVWAPTRQGPNPPRNQPLVEIAPPDDAVSAFKMPPAKGYLGPSSEQVARAMQKVDELRYARELSVLLHEQKVPLPQALAQLKIKGIELPWAMQFIARTHGPQRLDKDIALAIEEVQADIYKTPENWTPTPDALGGLIQHPGLFNATTPKDLGKLGVTFRDANDKEYGSGLYSPPSRLITGFTNRGLSEPMMRYLLEHETTHALSNDLGEPGGTSPKGAHEGLNRVMAKGAIEPAKYRVLRDLSPDALYMANEGEALARLAEARLQYTAAQRAKRPLALDVDLPLSMLWGAR